MKKILIAIVLVSLFSCKKDDEVNCWECKYINPLPRIYSDLGCMTNKEFENFVLSDSLGNDLPNSEKNIRCRKK